MDNVVLLSGNSNVDLASKIAEKLGMKLNEKNIPTMFANTEWHPQIHDNLRGIYLSFNQVVFINLKISL